MFKHFGNNRVTGSSTSHTKEYNATNPRNFIMYSTYKLNHQLLCTIQNVSPDSSSISPSILKYNYVFPQLFHGYHHSPIRFPLINIPCCMKTNVMTSLSLHHWMVTFSVSVLLFTLRTNSVLTSVCFVLYTEGI
jgi:hypothetical protein